MKKIKSILAGAFIVTFLYALFMPLQLTRYTLTDGQHTIVFQTMIHIAHQEFYETVEADAKEYSDNGYTFLYECVRLGKSDSYDANKAGVPTYNLSSYVLGLSAQSSRQYFLAVQAAHGINADVDTDWLLEQYATVGLKTVEDTPQTKEDAQKEFASVKQTRGLTMNVGVPLFRVSSRVNMLFESFHELIGKHSAKNEVIIVRRNQYLYDTFVSVNSDKVYINYGAAHFANFYDLLKSHNSNWHIIETKNYPAF